MTAPTLESPLTETRQRSLAAMAARLRRESLLSTSEAGSGHPTSCLSCADLLSVLFFGIDVIPRAAERPGLRCGGRGPCDHVDEAPTGKIMIFARFSRFQLRTTQESPLAIPHLAPYRVWHEDDHAH